jgi:hypothetical protein
MTPVATGRLESDTSLMHVAGRKGSAPVRLGSVSVTGDVVLVARLSDDVVPGDDVVLSCQDGAVEATGVLIPSVSNG